MNRIQIAFVLSGALLISRPITAFGLDIEAGPILNPANGHRYYVLSYGTWTEAEAQAVSMGGHLATINDGAENLFLVTHLEVGEPAFNRFFIGLVDPSLQGTYGWVSGEAINYYNWSPGEPNNVADETVGELVQSSGKWNNTHVNAGGRFAIVEVAGPIRVPEDVASIQTAIDASPHGSTILIGPGTYHECLTIDGKRLTLRGTSGAGLTIIDGDTNCRPLLVGPVGANGTSIEGLTFKNGYGDSGGGLRIDSTEARVSRCIFTQNYAEFVGGGVIGSATLVDCLFHHNTAVGPGGGLASYGPNTKLINCTFADNDALTVFFVSDDVYSGAGTIASQNSVFWSTWPTEGGFSYDHCILRASQEGSGYITSDPLLTATYCPAAGSPCIDAGEDDLHMNNGSGAVLDALNEGRYVRNSISDDLIDIGAMEFQSSPTAIPGDLNGDGLVNALDIQPFIDLLILP